MPSSTDAPVESPTTNPRVLEWIKSRAHADAQMLRAAATRDAVPGEVQDPEQRDVVTVLTRDHDRVTAMLQQLSTIPGHKKGGSAAQIERRQSIVDVITVALSQHESAEEEFLWPAVRKHLEHGDEIADTALGQEQEGKDTLAALGKADPDSDEYDDLVEQFIARARQHVAFEDQVFLILTAILDESERDKLGRKIATAKKAAPTRPHPHAPKAAPAVKAVGVPTAAADKIRDAVGDRPSQRRGKAAGEREGKQRQAKQAAAEREGKQREAEQAEG